MTTADIMFGAPWDRTTTVITALSVAVTLVGGAIPLWLAWRGMGLAPAWRIPPVVGGAVILATIVVTASRAPRGYTVSADAVNVRRWAAAPLVTPLAEIASVRELGPAELSGSIRRFGSGGMFG